MTLSSDLDKALWPSAEKPAWVSAATFTQSEPAQSTANARHRGRMSVQKLLEWAFGAENASIALDDDWGADNCRPSRGFEAVLIERGELGGVRIDTSIGCSRPADDAEIIASVVSYSLLPGLALRVAELARTGRTPDWMEGVTPKCVPLEWRNTRHGRRAKTIKAGVEIVCVRGRHREFERRACPVTYYPSAREIGMARRAYLDWWGALFTIREALKVAGMSRHAVTDEMPTKVPWKK